MNKKFKDLEDLKKYDDSPKIINNLGKELSKEDVEILMKINEELKEKDKKFFEDNKESEQMKRIMPWRFK